MDPERNSITSGPDLGADIFLAQGQDYSEVNNTQDSLLEYFKALEVLQNDRGYYDIEVANTFMRIAEVYNGTKEYTKGLQQLKQAFKIYQEVLGSKNLKVVQCLIKIIENYLALGQKYLNEAMEQAKLFSQCIPKELEEQDQLEVSQFFDSIAELLYKVQDYEQSISILQKSLTIAKRALNTECHEIIAQQYYKIGNCHLSLKNWDPALKSLLASLTIQGKLGQDATNNDQISDQFLTVALNLNSSDRSEDSMTILKKLLTLFPEKEQKPRLAEIYTVIGDILIINKKFREAGIYHQRSLQIFTKNLEHCHIQIARACNRVNLVYYKCGQHPEALKLFQKMIMVIKKLFGPNDIKVTESIKTQGYYEQINDFYADPYWKQVDEAIYGKNIKDKY